MGHSGEGLAVLHTTGSRRREIYSTIWQEWHGSGRAFEMESIVVASFGKQSVTKITWDKTIDKKRGIRNLRKY